MRISTRLALVLASAFALIMAGYATFTMNRRAALLRDGLTRETELLAQTLQIVTDNALRDGRFADLDQVFEEVVADRETAIAAVVGADGRIVTGGTPGDTACLRAVFPGGRVASPADGWVRCGERVRWVALPTEDPSRAVVLARTSDLIARDAVASRWRLLLLTLLLTSIAAAIVHLVLRRTLSRPLEEILRGIRQLGAEYRPEPVHLRASAGELRQVGLAFNQMVEERVALEARLREAESFALIGRLSGSLAHELGSPLNVIGMRAEAIAADPGATPAARRNAVAVGTEVERISRLIEGLLHIGRRREIQRETIDVCEVIRGAAEQMASQAADGGIAVQLRTPADPLRTQGDATLLRHALVNLLRNAVQAIQSEPRSRPRVRVHAKREGARIRIVVADDGPGIAPGNAAQLFEPFFTTKEAGAGMGLGLAITRGIVEEHGGTVHLEPAGERGTRAILVLPAIDDTTEGEGDG